MLDATSGPFVQVRATRPQAVQDSSGRRLILGGAVAFPAAPDYHVPGVIVGSIGYILREAFRVDEGAGKDDPGTACGLHDAGPVRGREGEGGIRRYL